MLMTRSSMTSSGKNKKQAEQGRQLQRGDAPTEQLPKER